MLSSVAMALVALPAASYKLSVGLPHRDPETLESWFWSVSDPNSQQYLRHRSLRELRLVAGATDADVEAVKQWLMSLGADESAVEVSALRDVVSARVNDATEMPSIEDCPIEVDFVIRRDTTQPSPTSSSQLPHLKVGPDGPTISQQKIAYGMPEDLQASENDTLQMVWGPGTFGYHENQLIAFRDKYCPLINIDKVHVDGNHGEAGGDNFHEANLDVQMITAFGLNITTLVSNTNTSLSTEEGEGFGQAFLDFVTELASREIVPHVLSLSLGSLSPASCGILCSEMVKKGHTQEACHDYMQQQRQVCMYLSTKQAARIDAGLQILGVRGVSIFAASGDGGSHFSFEKFKPLIWHDADAQQFADDLNEISCRFQLPTYPASSPYVVAVGGTEWADDSGKNPVACPFAGAGFSWEFAAPTHQRSAVTSYLASAAGLPASESFNSSGRAYPDIAAIAASGTSESTPTVAGMFSMIIDLRLRHGLPPLGFVAPRIWQIAESNPGAAFDDILVGNTSYGCDNGFPAQVGWDPASGWGRPVWSGMRKFFASDDYLEVAVV